MLGGLCLSDPTASVLGTAVENKAVQATRQNHDDCRNQSRYPLYIENARSYIEDHQGRTPALNVDLRSMLDMRFGFRDMKYNQMQSTHSSERRNQEDLT